MFGWWGQLRRYPLIGLGVVGAGLWVMGHGWEAGLTLGVGGLALAWLWGRRCLVAKTPAGAPASPRLTRPEVETYLAQLGQELADLEQELGEPQPDLQQDWQALHQALDTPLSIAWAGTWTTLPTLDAPVAVTDAHPAWVIYGVQDRLATAQLETLTRYRQQEQPVQVVWQTAPWQPPTLRQEVQAQLQHIGYTQPLLSITPQPPAVWVRRLQGDGTWEESWEIPPPVLDELVQWLAQRRQEPHWQYRAVIRRGKAFQATLEQRRQAFRAQQAQRIIHKYRLWAAVTAGVNPVPSLDLWATGAINAQMLVDLAQVYRRPLTLSQAKDLVMALGRVLVQMGTIEWVTQWAGTWLKSHWLTYGLGGAVQALSAAYVTHLAGETFVENLQKTPPRELTPGIWQSLRTRLRPPLDGEKLWQQVLPHLRLSH